MYLKYVFEIRIYTYLRINAYFEMHTKCVFRRPISDGLENVSCYLHKYKYKNISI